MKLLIVCQYFYPERFRINDICFELVKQGNEVTVLTGLPNYPDGIVNADYKKTRFEKINGVKVVRSWLIGRGNSKKTLFLNYLSFAISASFKASLLEKEFDKILVYQLSPISMVIPGIVAKKKLKLPLIVYTHDLWPESIASGGINSRSFIYKIVKYLSKKIYQQADEIWLSSKMFEQYFIEYLHIQKPMYHLPVYAEELFSHIETRIDNNLINLLFAGNIGEMQSVETIVLAARELKEHKNIIFHIVGDGSSKERCEKLKEEFELENVIFHGSHPLEKMKYFYTLADAFLVTLKDNDSISYTLPNKVQSYLAAGKPIIGSINGETAKVIKDANCGFIVEAENHIKLAKVIVEFSEIKNKTYLHENAKKFYAENYSKKIYFEKLNKALKS